MIWGVRICVLVIFCYVSSSIHRTVRVQESQIVPKMPTTEQIKAVPDDNFEKLLSERTRTILIVLNARNTELNAKFAKFITKNENLHLEKPIYICQELYPHKFIQKLKLDDSAINIVEFNGEVKASVDKITLKTKLDQTLIDKLTQVSDP
ncbi:hypothetical protein Hs30E_12520 [Lactococcus hodotermopsidis]|uniref:Uncharacterized protein n=1 Tax=Pseudolactococcus hodotermopsidis TaxID=2709157 RepID=A0A6A0BEC7_9LACT|nr:hypothetical protein Hs30E_12520 [Lactococcus hodotermopsidis]